MKKLISARFEGKDQKTGRAVQKGQFELKKYEGPIGLLGLGFLHNILCRVLFLHSFRLGTEPATPFLLHNSDSFSQRQTSTHGSAAKEGPYFLKLWQADHRRSV